MQKSNCFFRVSSVVVGLGLASQVFAAGFQISEMSPPIQATALADAATAVGDVTGQAYNPATLATVQGTQIYAGGSVILPNIGFSNASGQIQNIPIIGSKTVSGVTAANGIAPIAAVPAVYASTPLNFISPDLVAGIGINTQWGLSTDYPDDWVGQFSAIDTSIKTLDITPAIAYQVEPWLSLGAGINFQRFSATLSTDTYNTQYTGAVQSIAFESLSGNSWAAGYVLGALITPRQGTEIGLDYRSQVTQSLNGNITGTVLQVDNGLFGPVNAPINGTGNTSITLPAVINLGISQQITDKFTLMADAQHTGWNSMQDLNINANISAVVLNVPQNSTVNENNPLNWHGTWLYSLGGSYQLTQKLKVLGGVAYDETPTNNTDRSAMLPDSNREWLSTGLIFNATKNLAFDATFTHIFMHNQSINNVSTPVAGQPTYVTSADYSGYANIAAAGVNYTF